MKRSAWLAFAPFALLLAASCGSESKENGSGFGNAGIAFGGGSGSGLAGANGGSGGPGGDGVCQVTTVGTGRLAPDVLIVIDRSLSMEDGGRWLPSVSAVKAVTADLQSRVAFGLMAFPGTGGGGGRNDLTCSAGRLNVPVAQGSAGAIAEALDAMRPGGATPTAVTLQAAHEYITGLQGGPDDRPTPKYVLLVTDGAPNCTGGVPPMGNTGTTGSGEPAQVDASVAQIEAMAQEGIRTYVLGYDTQSDPALKTALDRMAQAGGTGDTAHRPVGNEQSLVSELRAITGTAISCEFVLDEAVADKSYVKVLFDGRQLNVDDPNGWALSGDRRIVALQGRACAAAKEEGHTISVSVQCEPVGPLF